MVAVCTLGCDRKAFELHSWRHLLGLLGDYTLYVNYETQDQFGQQANAIIEEVSRIKVNAGENSPRVSLDVWTWGTPYGYDWRKRPQFDQDQARLGPIVCARNMCIEYAMQTDATHLLFIDGDIIPPADIIPKLLAVDHGAAAGLVHGRGVHSSLQYVFGEKRRYMRGNPAFEVIEAEHANIGFTMLQRRLFEAIRMRWGTSHYPDGRVNMTSDDPAYHLDAFLKFGEWMLIRTDVVGQHVGDLQPGHTAQF